MMPRSMFRGREMTTDTAFTHRVRRLAVISFIMLGVIALCADQTTEAPPWVLGLLVLGWVTMPIVLAKSIAKPELRYALAGPAIAVSLGLVGLVAWWLPAGAAGLGWLLITAGVLVGGGLGLWFWFRFVAVPRSLEDPFGWGRITLVAVHVALVLGGLALIVSSFD